MRPNRKARFPARDEKPYGEKKHVLYIILFLLPSFFLLPRLSLYRARCIIVTYILRNRVFRHNKYTLITFLIVWGMIILDEHTSKYSQLPYLSLSHSHTLFSLSLSFSPSYSRFLYLIRILISNTRLSLIRTLLLLSFITTILELDSNNRNNNI